MKRGADAEKCLSIPKEVWGLSLISRILSSSTGSRKTERVRCKILFCRWIYISVLSTSLFVVLVYTIYHYTSECNEKGGNNNIFKERRYYPTFVQSILWVASIELRTRNFSCYIDHDQIFTSFLSPGCRSCSLFTLDGSLNVARKFDNGRKPSLCVIGSGGIQRGNGMPRQKGTCVRFVRILELPINKKTPEFTQTRAPTIYISEKRLDYRWTLCSSWQCDELLHNFSSFSTFSYILNKNIKWI